MELLSLKWNNHRAAFFHVLKNLRNKESFTDATLVCEGQFLQVHKLVLATCSDYLSEIFEKITCKSPVVLINGIELKHLMPLLDYMYVGEVEVPQGELTSLIKAAENLQIKGLAVTDEEPTASTSKRSIDSEESSQPKRRRSRESSGFSQSSARTNSKSHPSETEEDPEHVFPMDVLKVEQEEDSMNSITKQEEFSAQDRVSQFPTFEEELDFKKESYTGEEYNQKEDDSKNFLDGSTGLPWEGEQYQDAHRSQDTSHQAATDGKSHRSLSRQSPKNISTYVCNFCDKKFRSPTDLNRHIMVHTGEKPFQCTICSKTFNRRGTLKRHMVLHVNKDWN